MNLQLEAKQISKMDTILRSIVLTSWALLLAGAYLYFHLSMEEMFFTATLPSFPMLVSFFLVIFWINRKQSELRKRWEEEVDRLNDVFETEVENLKRAREAHTAELESQTFQSIFTLPTIVSVNSSNDLPS